MSKSSVINLLTLTGLASALFLLPLKTSLSNVGLGILVLSTLLSFFKYGINIAPLKRSSFYLFTPIFLFILLCLGFFNSPNKINALDQLIQGAFMGLIPLTTLRKDLNINQLTKLSSYSFIIGCVCSALFLHGINFYHISQETWSWFNVLGAHHTSFSFTEPLKRMHPIYLGSYYLMALLLIFNTTVRLKKWIVVAITCLLLLTIVFLNSRIIYFSTILVIGVSLFKHLSLRTVSLITIGILLLFYISLPQLKKTYVYQKMVYGTLWDLSNNIGTHPGTSDEYKADSRMSRWIVSVELINEKPLLGYGTGMERPALSKKYKANNMRVSYQNGYNAHNQYLGLSIRFGLIGGILLITYLSATLIMGIRKRDFVLIGYALILFSICLVENYLDRNMGLSFVAVFGTLLYLWHHNTPVQLDDNIKEN